LERVQAADLKLSIIRVGFINNIPSAMEILCQTLHKAFHRAKDWTQDDNLSG
jgi:hypothetical protein